MCSQIRERDAGTDQRRKQNIGVFAWPPRCGGALFPSPHQPYAGVAFIREGSPRGVRTENKLKAQPLETQHNNFEDVAGNVKADSVARGYVMLVALSELEMTPTPPRTSLAPTGTYPNTTVSQATSLRTNA